MRLSEYLDEKKISDADFGLRIKVTRQAVHRYRSGERLPDQPTMERIFRETGEQVTPNDFFGISAKPVLSDETEPARAAE